LTVLRPRQYEYAAAKPKVLTMTGEVKQRREILELSSLVPRIRKLGAGFPKLVEERVHHGLDRPEALRRCIFEELGNKVNSVAVSLPEHLVERMRLDLGELVFHVVRVHGSNLFPSRRAQNLDDLHQLIDP